MPNRPICVMIVEDEQVLLDVVTKRMKLNKVKPISFNRGISALAYLNDKFSEHELPDIIWLDYNLADMDGLEFVTELRKDARLAKIPVIVVSNSMNEEKIQAMLNLGVKEYFIKAEHRLDDLIEMLYKYV